MSSTGANGRSYEDNWKDHERLIANAQFLNEQLREAEAQRNQAAASLAQDRAALTVDEVRGREEALGALEDRRNGLSTKLEEARTAIGALELAAGPEHAGWLERREPPPPAALERADSAMSKINAFVQVVTIVQTTVGTPELPRIQPMDVAIVQPYQGPIDIGKGIEDGYNPPSREETNKRIDEFEKGRTGHDDAQRNAPSREPPEPKLPGDPDPMGTRHQAEREALEQRLQAERENLAARHERLNTEPEILRGWQERQAEQQLHEQQQQALRQEREREQERQARLIAQERQR